MEELSIAQVEKEWNEKHVIPFDIVFTHVLDSCHHEPFDGYTEKFKAAVQGTLQCMKCDCLCYDDVVGCERFDSEHKYDSVIKQYLQHLSDAEDDYLLDLRARQERSWYDEDGVLRYP